MAKTIEQLDRNQLVFICRTDDEIKTVVDKARQKRKWRGIGLEIYDNLFLVSGYAFSVKDDLRGFGFRWNAVERAWCSEHQAVAAKLLDILPLNKISTDVKDAMKSHIRILNSECTLGRWIESHLTMEIIRSVRERLTPEIKKALVSAIALLSGADEDKAKVVNGVGWSKAHSEIGHTLHLVGLPKYQHAAIAWQLCWTYRKQIPAHLVAILFNDSTCAK